MSEPISFGAWLRQRRRSLDLTQGQLAALVACALGTLRNIETDNTRPSEQLAARLVRTLGVPENDISTMVEFARGLGESPASAAVVSTPPLELRAPPASQLVREQRYAQLPTQLTGFVGRAEIIASVHTLLLRPDVRLVTLTGPGGVGKTRVAMQVAAELSDAFADGVAFVDLSAVREASLVLPTIAQTVGVAEGDGQSLQDRVQTAMRGQELLFLLDNFEQVVEAAPVITSLLAACPQIKGLVTSRMTLGVAGEYEWPVPPLSLPDRTNMPPIKQLSQYEAVRLFTERARAANPQFAMTTGNAPAVAEICHQLDGLPLAIELAAAQSRLFKPHALLARLDKRLTFLTGGRDRPTRQHTLRATLEWSYQLLSPPEQRLLAWLSMFIGGASLEAITAVWSDNKQTLDVVNGLAALISHSLVQPSVGSEMPRYSLLEIVREYGREQLVHCGESAAAATQHIAYFQQFAITHNRNIHQDPRIRATITQDYPNLRAALREALDRHLVDQALTISYHLSFFWLGSGYLREGWQLLQLVFALPLPIDASRELQLRRAHLLKQAANIAEELGEHTQSRQLVEAALATARTFNDQLLLAQCLNDLSCYPDPIHGNEQQILMLEEALDLYQQLAGHNGIAIVNLRLGILERERKSYVAAKKYYLTAIDLFRAHNHRRGVVAALNNLGELLISEQQYDEAEAMLREALTISYELDNQVTLIHNLITLGSLALARSDSAAAQTSFAEALQRADQGEYSVLAVFIIGYTGWLAEIQGATGNAARLLGGYDALILAHRSGANMLDADDEAQLHSARDRVREQLGEQAFVMHYGAGQQMILPEVMSVAREVLGVYSGSQIV